MNETLQTWLKEQITTLKDQRLYKSLIIMESPSGARISVNGKHNVINLASNNYLGLANHPKLKEAAIAAVEKWGAGAGAVRPIIGTMSLHVELERKLAQFKQILSDLKSGYEILFGGYNTIKNISISPNFSSRLCWIQDIGFVAIFPLIPNHCHAWIRYF